MRPERANASLRPKCCAFRPGRPGSQRAIAPGGLLLERLLEARRIFERCETRRRPATGSPRTAAPGGRDRRGCAEHRAVHEGAETFASLVVLVHETILRWSCAHSETYFST